MAFFIVHYTYTDDAALVAHVRPEHRAFTRGLFEGGQMRAGGPTVGTGPSAFLLMVGESAESVGGLLDDDPFQKEGVIAQRTITQWNPVTGVFSDEADA